MKKGCRPCERHLRRLSSDCQDIRGRRYKCRWNLKWSEQTIPHGWPHIGLCTSIYDKKDHTSPRMAITQSDKTTNKATKVMLDKPVSTTAECTETGGNVHHFRLSTPGWLLSAANAKPALTAEKPNLTSIRFPLAALGCVCIHRGEGIVSWSIKRCYIRTHCDCILALKERYVAT